MDYNLYQSFEFSLPSLPYYLFLIPMSFIIFSAISIKFRNNPYEGLIIFSYHSIWAVIALVLSQYHGFSDAGSWVFDAYERSHYGKPYISTFNFNSFTQNKFLYLLSVSLIKVNFDFLSIHFFHNFFSSLGLLFFYFGVTKNKKKISKFLGFLIILFPSFMLWTSFISKDALILFPIGLFIYYSDDFYKNRFKIILLFILIILIRPYVGLLFVLVTIIYQLTIIMFYKKNIMNIFITLTSLIFFLILFNLIWSKGIYNIPNYITTIQGQYQNENFAISKDLNFILRILSYNFRPFIFDIRPNIIVLALILENIFLLLTLAFLILQLEYKKLFKKKENIFYIILIIVFVIFFSQVSNNYGTGMRIKWMTFPFIFYFLIRNQKNY